MHRRLTEIPFETALRRGLGRAVLYLYENDPTPYRPLILKHCLRSHRYEPMFEDSRARYVFDLIHAAGDPEPFARRIVKNVASPEGVGDWHHLFELAELLAKNGDETARTAMYTGFQRGMAEYALWSPLDCLIRLDGVNGYAFVAEQLAKHQDRMTDDAWVHTWAIDELAESMAETPPHRALALVHGLNPSLSDYLDESFALWESTQAKPPRGNNPASDEVPTYETIRAAIEGRDGVGRVRAWWGEELDDAAFNRLAAEIIAESDPEILRRGLRLFQRRPFPRDPALLFPLLPHTNRRVSREVADTLALVQSPSVRAFALHLLDDDATLDYGLEILIGNPGPGDTARFTEILARPWDDFTRHNLLMDLRRYIEANDPENAIPLLLKGYEETPCSFCRGSFIDLLLEYGPLPDWIIEEGCYDASEEVRQLTASAR